RMEMLKRAEQARFSRALRDEGIDVNVARQVARTRDQLLRIARSAKSRSTGTNREGTRKEPDRKYPTNSAADTSLAISRPSEESLLKLLLLAYPERVCKRRSADPLAG